MVIADFRSNFPEFADATAYPDSMITFWATVAENQVVKCRWGNLYTQGVMLYVAHEIVMARQNVQAASNGGPPGQSGGIASQKAVGAVSVSYDPTTTTEKDAGWWNMSNYGKQFIRLARIFGAGAVQL